MPIPQTIILFPEIELRTRATERSAMSFRDIADLFRICGFYYLNPHPQE